MMRNNFNIDRYLDEAEEKFSGFYGDDYDDYDDFIGDDFDLFEGEDDDDYMDYSNATGGGVDMLKTPAPYQVLVQNTTAGSLNLVLFGYNQFLLSTNFGSSVGLTVLPAQTNVNYLQLLTQSSSQPFETSLIRVQSTNASQVTQIITVTVSDANGQSATLPIITQSYFSSYQQQSGILDVPYSVKIDSNTSLTSTILSNTTVTYTFFPAEKVNPAKGLSGQGALQVYGNPQVNLGGMSFPKKPMLQGRPILQGRPRRKLRRLTRRR
jgi:hypothetical protein